MDPLIQRVVQEPIAYNYLSGPDKVRSLPAAREQGLNCGALVHLLIRELFKRDLPPQLMCFELIYDQEHFLNLHPDEMSRKGDVFVVGQGGLTEVLNEFEEEYTSFGSLRNIEKHPRVHLLMDTGYSKSPQDPFLVHATPYAGGGVKVWPLSTVMKYRNYSHLYRRKRLKDQLFDSTFTCSTTPL